MPSKLWLQMEPFRCKSNKFSISTFFFLRPVAPGFRGWKKHPPKKETKNSGCTYSTPHDFHRGFHFKASVSPTRVPSWRSFPVSPLKCRHAGTPGGNTGTYLASTWLLGRTQPFWLVGAIDIANFTRQAQNYLGKLSPNISWEPSNCMNLWSPATWSLKNSHRR